MNDWTAVLNHLIAAWIAAAPRDGEGVPGRAWALQALELEPDGFRLAIRLDAGGAEGELLLRGRIEAEHGGRQKLHLACERAPERLPEIVAALRPLLETARLALELDFREPAQA